MSKYRNKNKMLEFVYVTLLSLICAVALFNTYLAKTLFSIVVIILVLQAVLLLSARPPKGSLTALKTEKEPQKREAQTHGTRPKYFIYEKIVAVTGFIFCTHTILRTIDTMDRYLVFNRLAAPQVLLDIILFLLGFYLFSYTYLIRIPRVSSNIYLLGWIVTTGLGSFLVQANLIKFAATKRVVFFLICISFLAGLGILLFTKHEYQPPHRGTAGE